VVIWLVDTGDSYEDAYDFVGEASVTLPVLLDSDGSLYGGYSALEQNEAYGPFPLQIIIGRDGTIEYLSNQYDADAVRDTIDRLLAEG